MAFRDSARKPLLWLLPATLILATGGGERDAARRRLYAPTLLASLAAMAFRDSARKPLLWLLPATLILATGGGERDAARRRLYAPTLLAAWLVPGVVTAALAANGGRIMRFARWKRLLLALGLNAFCIFLALDAVADRLLGEQGPVSLGVARVVCALTAAAAHLDFGWVHGE